MASHLIDRLVNQYEVVVLDDLSRGSLDNIREHINDKRIKFIKGSITSESDVKESLEGVNTVFHFAAQPDVRLSVSNPIHDFDVNVVGGMKILEQMRKQEIHRILFASSGGAVYGDFRGQASSEDSALRPISNYGAAKCAFEMYLSSYSELYGFSAFSLRFANVIGPRLIHGVIFDFYNKLKRDPTKLEVLGTGDQNKAYIYVTDSIDATLLLAEKLERRYTPINVSSGQRLSVKQIAKIVCSFLGFPDAEIKYTRNKRGWSGDVFLTDIDISLLESFGWQSLIDIEDGIKFYLQWLVEKYGPIV